MSNTIDNTQDVIGSYDIIERIDELASMITRTEEEREEYVNLIMLANTCEEYASDWQYGETLIRRSYFVEYVQEMLEDCGEIPKDIPWYIAIDWDVTAKNIESDYISVDYDGVEYLIRCV